MDPLPHKTRQAWNEPGHAHFLTYSCYRRLPLLSRDRSPRWVIDEMAATRRKFGRRTMGVCHHARARSPAAVFAAVGLRDASDSRRAQRPVSDHAREYLEQTASDAWLERLSVEYPSRRVFRFWQPGGGFDHNIFKEKTVQAVVDYIHENPVRRGSSSIRPSGCCRVRASGRGGTTSRFGWTNPKPEQHCSRAVAHRAAHLDEQCHRP